MSPAAADLLWDQVSGTLFCTKEQYLQSLADWTATEIECGIVLSRGTEIHFACKPGVVGTRRLLREHLGRVISQHGFATTRVPRSRQTGHRFVTRLGFIKTHADALDIHYKIERMRHV